MLSALLLVAVLGVCVLMLWASYKIEPHWVSKNGNRVICYGQALTHRGESLGRWRELRINKVGDDAVEVLPRRGSLIVERPTGDAMRVSGLLGRRRFRRPTYWKVAGQPPTAVRNRVVYMLDGNDEPGMPAMIAIRVPAKSKAIPMLDAVRVNRSKSASRPSPKTTQSADQPDPD